MRVFNGADELKAAVGEQLGTSDWVTVEQKQIDTFAEATGDHQWIHVDAEKAKDGPFGGTIAHGYLTLSLLPVFSAQVYKVENVKMGINYGLNKVRFTSPVPVNSRLRGSFELLEVSEVK
ncbi:MAG TPA: MaoC family dehydratase, partial [Pseudonocardia sp.]